MIKLFYYKEKHNIKILAIYMLTLVIFGLIYMNADESKMSFYFLIWVVFMTEFMKVGMFTLTSYFSKNSEVGIFKTGMSNLTNQLKMHGMGIIKFTTYNLIYTVARLIPFWLIVYLLEFQQPSVIFLVVISSLYIVVAITGPVHLIFSSFQVGVYIENSHLSKKKRKNIYKIKIKSEYKHINDKIFNIVLKLLTFGYLLVMFSMYTLFFDSVRLYFSLSTSMCLIIFFIGLLSILTYASYILLIQTIQDR